MKPFVFYTVTHPDWGVCRVERTQRKALQEMVGFTHTLDTARVWGMKIHRIEFHCSPLTAVKALLFVDSAFRDDTLVKREQIWPHVRAPKPPELAAGGNDT